MDNNISCLTAPITLYVMQEYDQHLAAVNTITFTDGGRRFLTSSDDKSMRVWEYGIPVVMKVRHALYIVYVCVHATFVTASVGCT